MLCSVSEALLPLRLVPGLTSSAPDTNAHRSVLQQSFSLAWVSRRAYIADELQRQAWRTRMAMGGMFLHLPAETDV